MAAPSDRNARIALVKGWSMAQVQIGARPDFVGTLEGVDMMLWELGPAWSVRRFQNKWICYHTFGLLVLAESFLSDKLGDCVGDAWLSVKEAADGS